MDISKMTLTELKALAYDLIAQRERIQNDLGLVNQRIAQLGQEEGKASPQARAALKKKDESAT